MNVITVYRSSVATVYSNLGITVYHFSENTVYRNSGIYFFWYSGIPELYNFFFRYCGLRNTVLPEIRNSDCRYMVFSYTGHTGKRSGITVYRWTPDSRYTVGNPSPVPLPGPQLL